MNNNKFMFSFGTVENTLGEESSLNAEYNIVSTHEYMFKGYNPTTKMVSIINPHSASTVIEVPLNILSQYVRYLGLAGLKK